MIVTKCAQNTSFQGGCASQKHLEGERESINIIVDIFYCPHKNLLTHLKYFN